MGAVQVMTSVPKPFAVDKTEMKCLAVTGIEMTGKSPIEKSVPL